MWPPRDNLNIHSARTSLARNTNTFENIFSTTQPPQYSNAQPRQQRKQQQQVSLLTLHRPICHVIMMETSVKRTAGFYRCLININQKFLSNCTRFCFYYELLRFFNQGSQWDLRKTKTASRINKRLFWHVCSAENNHSLLEKDKQLFLYPQT